MNTKSSNYIPSDTKIVQIIDKVNCEWDIIEEQEVFFRQNVIKMPAENTIVAKLGLVMFGSMKKKMNGISSILSESWSVL